ncbi:MAG: GMP/IMP nucleotidase [Pseudomonadota bacterium]
MKPFFDRDGIETVMLDMDGTILDLHFDDHFWREVIPMTYAERNEKRLADAIEELTPEFVSRQGTLDWYCLDFWSDLLKFNVAELKLEYRDLIRYLPRAKDFLAAVRDSGRRLLLVTNSHPEAMRIKFERTQLDQHFDDIYTSHHFGYPKENQEFWRRLKQAEDFDPNSTLFVDDSEAVLHAAKRFGIREVVAIARPDTTAQRRDIAGFASVDYLHELLG